MRDWWCHMKPELVPLEKRWKIRNKLNPDWGFFYVPSDSSIRNVLDSSLVKEKPELAQRRFQELRASALGLQP